MSRETQSGRPAGQFRRSNIWSYDAVSQIKYRKMPEIEITKEDVSGVRAPFSWHCCVRTHQRSRNVKARSTLVLNDRVGQIRKSRIVADWRIQ